MKQKNLIGDSKNGKKTGAAMVVCGIIVCILAIEAYVICSLFEKKLLGITLAVELINTALENTCDAITKEYNEYIKIAKDCGSAATFVIFIVAVLLNVIIFLPKIIALF